MKSSVADPDSVQQGISTESKVTASGKKQQSKSSMHISTGLCTQTDESWTTPAIS